MFSIDDFFYNMFLDDKQQFFFLIWNNIIISTKELFHTFNIAKDSFSPEHCAFPNNVSKSGFTSVRNTTENTFQTHEITRKFSVQHVITFTLFHCWQKIDALNPQCISSWITECYFFHWSGFFLLILLYFKEEHW